MAEYGVRLKGPEHASMDFKPDASGGPTFQVNQVQMKHDVLPI